VGKVHNPISPKHETCNIKGFKLTRVNTDSLNQLDALTDTYPDYCV